MGATFSRPPAATVLIVEDDPSTAMMLLDVLTDNGYRATSVSTGREAEVYLQRAQAPVDLIILDLRLPDTDGLVLCASIRSRYDVPIIICSATGRKQDRILALRLGADDFIAKPFEIDDLLARVQAVLRRSVGRQRVAPAPPVAASYTPPPPPAPARVGNLVLDRERRRVKLGDKDVPLTPSEFRLLAALMSRPDDVVTRDELAHVIWGPPGASTGRAIDVHIRRLRAKLAAAGAAPPEILTVRGSGYRIVADRTDLSA